MSVRHSEKLKGVDHRLADAVMHASMFLPFNIVVAEGLRSAARQAELWAQGRTQPGDIVTWVKHSNHQDGDAVDVYPLEPGGELSHDLKKFDLLAAQMKAAAKEIGFPIRWGADWDKDGKPREKGEGDNPHFEIDRTGK